MDSEALRRLLTAVRAGRLPVERALARLAALPPTGDLGFARVDHHRALRQGHPEVVYAPGKTPTQVAAIAKAIARRSGRVLVTRVDDAQARAVRRAVKGSVRSFTSVALLPKRREKRKGIALVTAGTSDLPVAEEARLTCRMMGCEPELVADVGVAGIHRLFAHLETLRAAQVLVVAAGMEGELPSVVGGLVAAPVIAVPTSVGYGTGAGGFAALLAMLNACAANVCCVNIDDGFGAGTLASLICSGSVERRS